MKHTLPSTLARSAPKSKLNRFSLHDVFSDRTVHDVQTRPQRSRGQRPVSRIRGRFDPDDLGGDQYHLRVQAAARRQRQKGQKNRQMGRTYRRSSRAGKAYGNIERCLNQG